MSDLFDRRQPGKLFVVDRAAAQNAQAESNDFWSRQNREQQAANQRRQENLDRYTVHLSDEQYEILNLAIANAEIPEDEAYNMASAIKLSERFDIPLADARLNLERYRDALFGTEKRYTPKDTFTAIADSWQIGLNTVALGRLGSELRQADDAWDAEKAAALREEIQAIQRENESLADHQDRNLFIEALKFGAQSAPFSAAVAVPAIVGSLLAPWVGTAAGFAVSMGLTTGQEYIDLLDAGAESEIAFKVAPLSGAIQAAVEMALGNVASAAGGAVKLLGKKAIGPGSPAQALAEKLTADIFKRLHFSGGFTRAALRLGAGHVLGALEEGVEEVVQELTSAAALQAAATLQGEGVEAKTARELGAAVGESFRGGLLGSLVLGLPGTALNTAATVKDANAVAAAAEAIPSKEAFKQATAGSKVFEGLSGEQREAAQDELYDRAQKRRDREEAQVVAEIKETMDLGEGAAERVSAPGEEESAGRKKEFRTENGSLYIDHDKKEGPGKMVSGIFKAGNALEETSHNRYGHISYTQDGDKIAISDFKMAPEWEYLREEVYRDFAQHFSGYDIAWDPQTDAGIAIKERLESQNPRGENAGLTYYADPATAADDRVRSDIISRTLGLTARANATELSAVLDLFETMIKPKGLGLAEAWEEWFGGEKITGTASRAVEAAQKEGALIKGAASFAQVAGQAKALIYVSKNADASTLLHEFTHVAEAHFTPEERRIAARALNGVALQKQGKQIAVAFDENAQLWTNDQKEAFAENFETYLATGKAPEAIKPLFEKIKEFMRRIYRSIRDAIPLSKDAKQFYESFATGDLFRQAEALKAEGSQGTTPETEAAPGREAAASGRKEQAKIVLGSPVASFSAKAAAAVDYSGVDYSDDIFQEESLQKDPSYKAWTETINALNGFIQEGGVVDSKNNSKIKKLNNIPRLLKKPMSVKEISALVKERLDAAGIQYTESQSKKSDSLYLHLHLPETHYTPRSPNKIRISDHENHYFPAEYSITLGKHGMRNVEYAGQGQGKPWPENFSKTTQFSTILKMKSHADYVAAKAGDAVAASRLILDIMSGKNQQAKLRALAEKHQDAIVAGVHAEERSGRNSIPRVLARYIGQTTGFDVDTDIVQTEKVGRTGSDAWRRMAFRPKFDGPVQKGRAYILVDDVVTSGGTFSELRCYIEMNGGVVVDMASMGAAQFSVNIALSPKTRLDIEAKYGINSLRQFLKEVGLYGGEHKALTESEARSLLAAGSLDAARNRIIKARREGSGQDRPGSVQGSEAAGQQAEELSPETSPDGQKYSFINISPQNTSEAAVLFQKALHGSPHFFDEFSLEHIGSGEGNQAHGYGLYFSKSEKVAKGYQDELTVDTTAISDGPSVKYIQEWQEWMYYEKWESPVSVSNYHENIALDEFNNAKGNIKKAKAAIRRMLKDEDIDEETAEQAIEMVNSFKYASPGFVYEVELPEHEQFLDEEMLLGDQSNYIKSAIKKLLENEKSILEDLGISEEDLQFLTVEDFYSRIASISGGESSASELLAEYGIKGIAYIGDSQYEKGGAQDYVVFSDSDVEITNTLFQTEEELVQDARSFDSWQEFMEYYEESPFRPDDARVPENADAQWYQTFWETARGMIPEESAINDELSDQWARDDEATDDPNALDALWMATEMTKEGLTKFLERIGVIAKTDMAHWQPINEEDAADRERTAMLQDRIKRELRHGSWLSNAIRVLDGKELTERQYRTLRTLVGNSVRDYRSLYAEIMDAPEYAVALADTTSAELSTRIADPEKAAVDLLSPEQRRRLAEELDIADVSRELENGTLKMVDERLEKAWNKLKEDKKELAQKIQDLQKETEEDYKHISDYQTRQLLQLAEDMNKAKLKWKNRSDKTARMIERGLSITKKYQRESQQLKSNYDALFRKFSDLKKAAEISGFVQEALARREAQFDERSRNDDLNRKARALAEIKRMRTQLVKRFNRRVRFDRIDYKNAVLIIALQRMMHPSMIRGVNKWIGTEGPLLRAVYSQYNTDSEFRAKLLETVSKVSAKRAVKLDGLLKKPYDQMTAADRQEIYKMLPKQDWVMDLGLLELEKERREAIQLPIKENKNDKGEIVSVTLGEELARMMDEALPYDLYGRIQNRAFADWTLEEAEQLAKVVDDLYSEGRREFRAKQEARKLRDERYRAAIARTITDAGIVIEPGDSPEEQKKKQAKIDRVIGKYNSGTPGTRQNRRSRQGRLSRILSGYGDANIRRVARVLDNGRDGVNTALLYWKENDAFNQKQRALFRRRRKVEASMQALGISLGDLTKKIVVKDFLSPGQSQEFTVEELLHVLLSQKEAQNRDAVMYGNFLAEKEKAPYRNSGISDEELFAMTNVALGRYNRAIEAADKYFAEKGNEKFLKFAEAIERDYAENGERMSRFTIEEFNKPMWRVNYYLPMNRLESTGETNANRVLEDLAGISTAPNKNYVGRGMTEKRIDISPEWQTPVILGLYSTWADSVERTEHLMAYGGLVRTLNSVYKSRDGGAIRQEIQERYGDGMTGYINEYVNELANPLASGQMSALDRIARALRGKTATAYLAWKISGIVKQAISSPAPFFQYMDFKEYAAAALDLAVHFNELSQAIKEKSMHMATRVFDPMLDLVREQHEKTENPLGHALNKFNEFGMKGLELIDWMCVAPGWLAVYRRELARLQKANQAESEILGQDEIEEQAVAKADDIVRLVQPSGRSVDLAPMFKGRGPNSEIARIFLQFQTSLNVIWQNIRYDMPLAVRQKQWMQAVGGVVAYAFAGIALGLAAEGFGGEDDKKKGKEVSWQQRFGFYATNQFSDSIPIVGNQVTAWARKAITGRGSYMPNNLFPVEKEFFDTITAAADAAQKQSEGKRKAAEEAWLRSAGNFADLLGYVFGAPVSGAKEMGRVFGVGDGDGELGLNPGALAGRR